jgi:acetyl esterase/lipase
VADANLTAIAWTDGSKWVRKAPRQESACCAHCEAHPLCRGWTILDSVCHLVASVGQHYPDPRGLSGYPLPSDAASQCVHFSDNGGHGAPSGTWGDTKMRSDISCAMLPPKGRTTNVSDFPRRWSASTAGGSRGVPWFFFPSAWCEGTAAHCGRCDCACQGAGCPSVYCQGPSAAALEKQGVRLFKDRPWAVFMHGGEFHWNNNIGADYAMLSSNVAAASAMGVLAIDYRTTAAVGEPGNGAYPAAIEDLVQACQWLRTRKGAAEIRLYGDSSGGTQTVQALLYIAQKKLDGVDLGFEVARAGTFSAWLDLTSSTPTFYTRKWCAPGLRPLLAAPRAPSLLRRQVPRCLRRDRRPGQQELAGLGADRARSQIVALHHRSSTLYQIH